MVREREMERIGQLDVVDGMLEGERERARTRRKEKRERKRNTKQSEREENRREGSFPTPFNLKGKYSVRSPLSH